MAVLTRQRGRQVYVCLQLFASVIDLIFGFSRKGNRNWLFNRSSCDGYEGMVKTHLALRGPFNARPNEDACFFVKETVFGRAADDEPTWYLCGDPPGVRPGGCL